MKSTKRNPNPSQADTLLGLSDPDMPRLAELILAHAPYDGVFELPVPGVHVARSSRINTELVYGVQQPGLCIVAQGAKSVMLQQEIYEYDASRMLIYSIDLPVAVQVTRASHAEPYLSFRLDLDPHKVADLVLRVYTLMVCIKSRKTAECTPLKPM